MEGLHAGRAREESVRGRSRRAAGRDESHAGMRGAGVHGVGRPAHLRGHRSRRIRTPVEVVDHQARSAQIGVPLDAFAVFQPEILAGHAGRDEIRLVGRLHRDDGQRLLLAERFGPDQPEHLTLEDRQIRRGLAAVVVVALVHHGKRAEQAVARAFLVIVHIVQVLETQEMAVFVADGADAGELVAGRTAVFGVEGEVRDPVAVDCQALVGDVPRLGPERVVAAAFGLVVAGEQQEDVVDVAVAVEIVAREVDAGRIGRLAGLDHQLLQVAVGFAVGVGAVPGRIFGEGHHVADLEGEVAVGTQIVAEPVEHAAGGAVFGIILLVEQVVDRGARRGHGEFPVAELDGDDDRPQVDRRFGGEEEGDGSTLRFQALGHGYTRLGQRIRDAPETVGALADGRPVEGRGPGAVLVAVEPDGQRRAVRLRDGDGIRVGFHRKKLQ